MSLDHPSNRESEGLDARLESLEEKDTDQSMQPFGTRPQPRVRLLGSAVLQHIVRKTIASQVQPSPVLIALGSGSQRRQMVADSVIEALISLLDAIFNC